MTVLTNGQRERDLLERIPVPDLVRAWRQDFGIDVAALFEGADQIELKRDPGSGVLHFDPPILGDAAFYQQLRAFKWYHPAQKREHVHAASVVAAGAFVLDVGAGIGDFARHLERVGYIGLESDPEAILAGRRAGRDLRCQTMSTWRGSADYRPANIITAFQVLEHVPAPQDFIAEMIQCLAPDGTLMIGVPDAESYVADLPDFMLNAPPHHITWWTEAALKHLLETAGLKVDAVTRFQVEPWEYQLWWMAKLSNWLPGRKARRFGRALRWRKILAFCLSWPLQRVSPPRSACGSTLLIQASRKAR
ncbi:MAG: class I SAM-dependent methyltransferase [Henriciella sp.]